MKNAKTVAIAALLWAAVGLRASSTITISTQPADKTVAVGAKLEFYVSAATSTTNALTYQWYKKAPGGSAGTTGANSSTNTVASAAAGDEAAYWVVITDVTSTNTSATNKVVVVAPPTISASPADKNLGLGSNYTFTVACSNRLGGYFWYRNATNLLGGATNSYAISGAQFTDAGNYTLVVSNVASLATSTPAMLAVFKYPVITNQLTASNVVAAGSSITNAVGVDGTSLAYQWYLKGKTATAAASTSNNLWFTSVGTNNTGAYFLVVTNPVGKVTSSNWYLTVIPPPAIGTAPKAQTLTNGQNLTLSVKATGTKPYTNLCYQWTFNATNKLAAGTNATLVISNAAPTNAGAYAVVITNFGGATTSSPVTVAVGADSVPPVLKITDPSKTNSATTNAIYTLKGTATDNVSVTNVAFSLDGINFTNATTTNAWAKWSVGVPLAVGSNTVWVQASDWSGNAVTNVIRLFYAKWYTLTITNVGSGTASLTGPSNQVQFGSNYVLTAKAVPHTLFIKWIGWRGLTISTNGTTNTWKATTNVIKFSVTNNVCITNEVDTNQFWNCAGTYTGLLWPVGTFTHTNCGLMTATVTSNLTYSAKLLVGGQTMSFSGQFDTNGNTTLAMPGAGWMSCVLSSSDFYGWYYDSNTNEIASFNAYPPGFSKTNLATNYAGTFTITIPPGGYTNSYPTNGNGFFNPGHEIINRTSSYSGSATNGFGYATVNLSSNGLATFAGVTADGQVVSQSVAVSQWGNWPLFVPMYPLNKTNTGGELIGYLRFEDRTRGYPVETTNGMVVLSNMPPHGQLGWIKAQNPAGVTNYPSGLTNVTWIMGSGFTPPTTASPQLLTNSYLGTISFTGGGLSTNVSAYFLADDSGTVYCYNSAVTIKIAKTGILSGKFPYNNNPKTLTPFGGVVLQQTNNFYWDQDIFLFQMEEFWNQTNSAVGTFSGPNGTTGSVILTPFNYP